MKGRWVPNASGYVTLRRIENHLCSILAGTVLNWGIFCAYILENVSVTKEKGQETALDYRRLKWLTTKCNIWSWVDPVTEEGKKCPKERYLDKWQNCTYGLHFKVLQQCYIYWIWWLCCGYLYIREYSSQEIYTLNIEM